MKHGAPQALRRRCANRRNYRRAGHALAGGAAVTVSYDDNGNIENKSDAGTYSYGGTTGGPHAVTGVTGGPLGAQTYSYDLNGNMRTGGGRITTPTSFNQAKVISDGSGHSSTFTFGAAHERVKQVAVNGSITNTTIYIGGIFELVTSSGGTEEKNYVMTPAGRVAVYTAGTYALPNVRYFHTDGLGSITAVSDESGNVVKRFAYDAWGKRTDPATGAVTTSATNGHFTRGFTDHEALDDLGLIHMNGRVYDPVLGRFLSADPFVGDEYDSQDYNRYSYVGNNPLNATDPSGYFSLKDAVKIVAVVAIAVIASYAAVQLWGITAGMNAAGGMTVTVNSSLAAALPGSTAVVNGIIGGAAGGFASGFAGSLLNGGSIGDAFKAGVIGGAVGAVTGGLAGAVGDAFGGVGDNGLGGEFGRALSHGAVSGGAAEAQGGEFRHGFYAGFAGSVGGSATDGMGGDSLGAVAARTSVSATLGGTASVLGGGKFANGAVTAAFQHLFNVEQHGRDLLQRASDFSAGFGDMISFGLTARFRRAFGYDDVVNYGSGDYKGGEYTAVGVSLATGGASVARGALAMGGRSGNLLVRFGRGFGRFFSDGRTYGSVSRQYWGSRGGAGTKQLHHWLFPQRGGAANAGYNLLV